MSRLCAVVTLLAIITITIFVGDAAAFAEGTGHYTIVASTQIRPHSDFTVAVSLHDNPVPTTIRLTIENGQRYTQSKEAVVQPFATVKVIFETGAMPDATDSGYRLIAEGISGLTFRNESQLQLNEKRFSVLVQTDKALYKPGDVMQFRVLVVDPSTKPYDVRGDMHVQVLDGRSNRIVQYTNVTTASGVYGNELQLSSFPVLGDWTIQVDVLGETKKKMVTVAEYVLPKFEVIIETAKEVLYLDGKIRAIIRARHLYGKPITGEATVTLQPKIYGSFQPFASDLISRKVVKINGKGAVEFDIDADLRLTDEYFQELQIDALVEEERTGRTQSAKFVINIRKSPFFIKSLTPVTHYKPGLPFEIIVQVHRHDKMPVKAVGSTIELMFKTDLSADTALLAETRVLDGNSQATFSKLLPLNGTSGYYVEAKYSDMIEGLGFIPRSDSAAGAYVQLKLVEQQPMIGQTFTVDVLSSVPMSYLTYQLLGRGDILATDTILMPDRTSHQLKFLASFAMVPMAEVIVFFVRDGQLVSAKLEVVMSESLQNQITLETAASKVTPGKTVEFTITTRPNSFVGVMASDQNAVMLKSGNDLFIEDVFAELKEYSQGYFRPYHHHPGQIPGSNQRIKRRSDYPFNHIAVDFTDSGAILMSNLHQVPTNFFDSGVDPTRNEIPYNPNETFTKKKTDIGPAHVLRTNTRPPLAGPFAFSRIPQPKWKRQRALLERTIENTWLFTSARAGTNGVLRLPTKVPATAATWIVTAFSLDPVTGLAITKTPFKLDVVQPLSIGLSVPPSVKRGEVLSIPIAVTSRLDSSATVEVTLHNEEQNFEFVDVADKAEASKLELYRRKRLTVKSNEAAATTFLIRPKRVGLTAIKVTATSPLYGDSVERYVSIDAEGVSQNLNTAIFVDLRSNGKMEGNMSLEIPKNAVPESIHAEVSVLSDIMASTIRNLGSLIDKPTGCGEQNLLDLVSGVIGINYLKRTNQLSAEVEANAVRLIASSYQNELSYVHPDGSFSAFGDTDQSGSTWLTAFVVRSFRQASSYIAVEQRIIDDALNWLESIQALNGSFPEVGNVIHADMQGGSGKGVALTAYTLLAFLENKSTIPAHRNAVNKAMDYIVRNLEGLDDVYALAVAAYALQVADHNAKDYVWRILKSRAVILKDGKKHWAKPIVGSETKNIWYRRPNSINTEITAYGQLALLSTGSNEARRHPIGEWLLAQRTESGGFGSTQDTLVGLSALAILGESLHIRETSIQVTAKYGKNVETNMRVSSGYSKDPQSYEIPASTNVVNITATGHGIAFVQLSYKYNLNVTGAWPRFTLDPQINRNSNNDYLHLTICTSFIQSEGATQSNMAVMEVELPSGFTADLNTIPSLEATENVKLVETKQQATVMIIYFENIGRKELCPTVDAFRTHKVAMQRPAAVTVYDYYDSSRRARMFYKVPNVSLCEICEAEDCTEACLIQASQQRSSSSDTASGRSSDGKGAATSAIIDTSLFAVMCISLGHVFCSRF